MALRLCGKTCENHGNHPEIMPLQTEIFMNIMPRTASWSLLPTVAIRKVVVTQSL
jgi:hypothetical protein